ncbi:serine/threonine-protein kinase RIO1-like [Iris pallida]|uniref:Serine/threonine-protein kinase RIO1-like n=1 Tax=Iris pallida TaxID=29817 RepID=A0AAX6EY33_IRIPA|nr:serine/threonine-protein kinase RIO1-like [Iris pallida]
MWEVNFWLCLETGWRGRERWPPWALGLYLDWQKLQTVEEEIPPPLPPESPASPVPPPPPSPTTIAPPPPLLLRPPLL